MEVSTKDPASETPDVTLTRPTMQKRTNSWQIPIMLASILLGVTITIQFRTQEKEGFPFYRQSDQMSSMVKSLEANNHDMQRMVKYLETERNKLQADLKETRDRVTSLEGGQGGPDEQIKGLKSDLLRSRILAGLVPVKGPGVIVTLTDSTKKPGPEDDPYFFLIHDTDIQSVVNELWAAGAEAIAVNDQRLVMTSSVRCVGPTVLCNAVRLAPPYVIRAIGDPKTLETALRMPGGVIANMEASTRQGVGVDVKASKDTLVLPEFKGANSYRYLQAAKEE